MAAIGLIGFGRVGRRLFRELYAQDGMEVRAISEINPCRRPGEELTADLAYLLAHDSIDGPFWGEVSARGQAILVDGREVALHLDQRPGDIDWAGAGVDVLVDATGCEDSMKRAARLAPEKVAKVLITRSSVSADVTLVPGVNLELYDRDRDHVVSCSTCTANALAPVLKVLDQGFGVERAAIATVHPALSGDTVLDAPGKEFAAGRSGLGVRPLSSEVAHTTAQVLPHLAGRLMGMSLRVPTMVVNALIADVVLARPPKQAAEVIEALASAADGPLSGVLALEEGFLGRPRVAMDFMGDPHSALVDLNWLTLSGNLLRLLIWHDNEYAYCARVVDVLRLVTGE